MNDAARAFDSRYQLSETLHTLGIPRDPALIERLWGYTSLLLRWNRTYNLTGARNEETLVREHLIDSLAAVPVLETRISQGPDRPFLLIDVGSGAGFPGIVIAIVHPDWPIALVEPIGKKAAFLRQAVAALGLTRTHPIADRLEATENALNALIPAPEAIRYFTCRAVATLQDLVTLIQPLSRPGSRLFALKSRHLDSELAAFPDASVHTLLVPGLGQSRTVVELPVTPPAEPDAAAAPRLR